MYVCGNIEAVELLLDNNADVNLLPPEGHTALMVTSDVRIAKLLLDRGAQIDAQADKTGYTALMVACEENRVEIVQLLLDRGAKVDTQASDGETALMIACGEGRIEIVQLLLDRGAKVDAQTSGGLTALMIACREGRIEIVQLLLDRGAKVDTQAYASGGLTALMFACGEGRIKIAQLLLDRGAEVDAKACDGQTALMIACSKGRIEIVQLLLDRGAKVDAQTYGGRTPLMIACGEGRIEIVQLLLVMIRSQVDGQAISEPLQANVDQQSNTGETALLLAVRQLDREAADLLLQCGAEIDLQDNQRLTPLMTATILGATSLFDLLLKYNPAIDIRDKDGRSALIHAVSNKHVDLAIRLLELGAEVNLQDNNGWSPLMYALQAGDMEMVQVVLAFGASVHLKNYAGETILDICPLEIKKDQLIQELDSRRTAEVFDFSTQYPEIAFLKIDLSERAIINHLEDMGISVCVPEDALGSTKDKIDLHISPCFSGPFELPPGFDSASPTYLIRPSRRVEFKKDVMIKISHHINLQTEEDCKDMVFLSASSTPAYRGSRPVYIFKEIQGVKTVFRPGDQVGEIYLRHFCLLKAACKRGRDSEEHSSDSSPKRHKDNQRNLYSIRCYRNLESKGPVSAIFCICLYHPLHIQNCDSVISRQYMCMRGDGRIRSQVYAEIVGDKVLVCSDEDNELHFNVTFDIVPSQILRDDIHIFERMDMEISQLPDYPPRLLIFVKQLTAPEAYVVPEVHVSGLNKPVSFKLPLSESGIPKLVKERASPVVKMKKTREQLELDNKSSVSVIDDKQLSIDDLGDVLVAVKAFSAQWRDFCTMLHLKDENLAAIASDNPGNSLSCLREAMRDWLKMNYDYKRHGKPSWRKLAEAAKSLDEAVYERIANEHPHIRD